MLDTDGVTADVPSVFGGMGNVNMSDGVVERRALADANPWSGPQPAMRRKLTHFRAPGMGDAMWSGQCVYDLAGVAESVSEYDQPDVYASDDGLTYSITGGIVKSQDDLSVGEFTTTRRSRVAAHFDSAPAARHFQGYMNTRWSGLMAGYRPSPPARNLAQNFNPNQQGSKELHKATQYQPFPPMGSIVGYYGTEKAL